MFTEKETIIECSICYSVSSTFYTHLKLNIWRATFCGAFRPNKLEIDLQNKWKSCIFYMFIWIWDAGWGLLYILYMVMVTSKWIFKPKCLLKWSRFLKRFFPLIWPFVVSELIIEDCVNYRLQKVLWFNNFLKIFHI